jgi:hypothetical protein
MGIGATPTLARSSTMKASVPVNPVLSQVRVEPDLTAVPSCEDNEEQKAYQLAGDILMKN